MAMLKEYGPDRAEIGEHFIRAAKSGQRYMLVVSTVLDDPDQVTLYHALDCVKDEKDILPLLEERGKAMPDAGIRLTGIFDLTRDYDGQAGKAGWYQLQETLSRATLSRLASMDAATQRQRDQRIRAGFPWYKRIFFARH